MHSLYFCELAIVHELSVLRAMKHTYVHVHAL